MKVKLSNLGSIGVITDKPAHELQVGAWSDVSNVTFRDGKIQKAMGNTEAYTGVACRPQWLIPYDDADSGAYHWVYPGIDDNGYGKIFAGTGTSHTNRTRKNAAAAISAISIANPTQVTIASTTYNDGDEVVITGSDSTPNIDGTYTLTKVDATHFTIPVNVTGAGTTGSASIDSDYAPDANIAWTGGILNGLLVVNNGVDTPQKWDRTTGVLDSDFEDLANWPSGYSARTIRPFRNFLIAMDVDDGVSSPSRNPFRVMWSDAADPYTEPSTWVAGPSNLAGDVYLSEGGDHVIDGAPMRGNFIVYKENSTYIMRYVGGNDVFAVDRLFNEHGILAQRCFAEFGDGMHFVVTKGNVIVHDGNTAKSIADDRVREKIFGEIDSTYYTMAFCTPYYKEEEIWFCYSVGSDGLADKAAIWNYKTGAWSFRTLTNCPHIAYGTVVTTGGESWGSISTNWNTETAAWSENVYSPASDDLLIIQRGSTDTTANATFQQVDSGNTFDGTLMSSYARMTKLDIAGFGGDGKPVSDPSLVKHLRRLYPKVSGGPVNFRVGSSMSQEDVVSWSDYLVYDPGSGNYKVDTRKTGRFLALEISSAADVDWQLDSVELDMDITSDGR